MVEVLELTVPQLEKEGLGGAVSTPGKQVGLLMTNCCWVMPFSRSACRICIDWKRS